MCLEHNCSLKGKFHWTGNLWRKVNITAVLSSLARVDARGSCCAYSSDRARKSYCVCKYNSLFFFEPELVLLYPDLKIQPIFKTGFFFLIIFSNNSKSFCELFRMIPGLAPAQQSTCLTFCMSLVSEINGTACSLRVNHVLQCSTTIGPLQLFSSVQIILGTLTEPQWLSHMMKNLCYR